MKNVSHLQCRCLANCFHLFLPMFFIIKCNVRYILQRRISLTRPESRLKPGQRQYTRNRAISRKKIFKTRRI